MQNIFSGICKKFQIPLSCRNCFSVNETVNGSLTHPATFVPDVGFNRTESDSCQPRHFIFNSQVTIIILFSKKYFREENRENNPLEVLRPKVKGDEVIASSLGNMVISSLLRTEKKVLVCIL